ncbi:hypothetical protein Goklo_026897 [Gossypium klotzschianum]|uniref:Uncharacterized protein n=1 Tax=Gossypium klotzschianum TaxID=34286 RepID=A0A7J8TWS3_9ROSI|nr:hypothetical protein [Gossypium klotzschianum]
MTGILTRIWLASDKQDRETYSEELEEDGQKPDLDEAFEDRMRKNLVDECVELDTIEVERTTLNTIVEHESLRINFHYQMEVGKSSEDVHIIEEIFDYIKVIVEEPSQFLRIVEEIPHHEPIKYKSSHGHIQWKEENSTKFEFVIPSWSILQEMLRGEIELDEKGFKRNLGKQPQARTLNTMESFDTSNEITYNTKKFVSLDAEGFFHKLHGRSIVYECGFDPDAIFENEFWDIVDLYGWMEFSVQSQRLAVPSAVHEFFASLKFSEEDKVYVIGREIEISSSVISKYYNVPFVANDEIELLDNRNFKGVNIDSIMLYLIEERGEWEREVYTNLPLSISLVLSYRLYNASRSMIFNPFQAIMLATICRGNKFRYFHIFG